MKFRTCANEACRHPFPLLVEGTSEALCPPCRKRVLRAPLTKSDLAFDAIHDWYQDANPDAVERAMARAHEAEGQLEAAAEAVARAESEAELLRRRVGELTRIADEGRETIRRLAAEVTAANLRAAANVFGGLFGGRPTSPPPPVDRAFVTDLLKLVHPDKHGGNDAAANAATARLLDLRKQLPR